MKANLNKSMPTHIVKQACKTAQDNRRFGENLPPVPKTGIDFFCMDQGHFIHPEFAQF
jgi:hypothetical protein